MVAELRSRREEYGKADSRRARALRARAGSRRGRRGRPVLQEPVLGTADGERRNCSGVLGVLFEVPKDSMSAAAMRGHRAGGKEEKTPGHVVLLNAAWRPKTRVV